MNLISHIRKYDFFMENDEFQKMLFILNNPEKSKYNELHHIIPKSIGGDDSSENLISLSLSQHFMIHYYLTFCTKGMLKRKMCFAFKQMLGTRFNHSEFKKLSEDEISLFSSRYEELVSESVFKNNYERTETIKALISNAVSTHGKKCKWCNNGTQEKFVDESIFLQLLENGFVKGRLKRLHKKTGPKKTLHERLEEFKRCVESKDSSKRFHVHFQDKESCLTGAAIARSNIPWEYGRIRVNENEKKQKQIESAQKGGKAASLKIKGLKWFTNGIKNIRLQTCPISFQPGITKIKN